MAELKPSLAAIASRIVCVIHGVTAVAELKHGRTCGRMRREPAVIHGVTAVAELKQAAPSSPNARNVIHGVTAVAELKHLYLCRRPRPCKRSHPRRHRRGRIEATSRIFIVVGSFAVIHGVTAVAELKPITAASDP